MTEGDRHALLAAIREELMITYGRDEPDAAAMVLLVIEERFELNRKEVTTTINDDDILSDVVAK